MSEVFENELAALNTVTGIHIDEDTMNETYSIFVSTRTVHVRRNFHMPEKWKPSLFEWTYFYSLACYWFSRLCS